MNIPLLKSNFIKNAITLSFGTGFAQIISIVTAPILYRIYDKVEYGTLGVYMATTGIISVFSTLQYQEAILICDKEKEARQIWWFVLTLTFYFTIITGLVMLFASNKIANLINSPQLGQWLYFAPLSIFASGFSSTLSVWANRKKYYKLLSLYSIIRALLVPITSISLGLIYDSPLGLFVGLWIGQIIPALFLFGSIQLKDSFSFSEIRWDNFKTVAKKYYKFPFYSLPTAFIDQFTNQLPVLMLSRFAGLGVVGTYNLSVRMLTLPIQLISSSIGEVFRQRASSDFNKFRNCEGIWKKTFWTLSIISVFPFTFLFLIAPEAFALVFGEQWREAGVFAQILGIAYMFKFVTQPLSFLFTIVQRQNEDFYWHIWILISNIAIFILGYQYFENTRLVLLIFSVNYAIIYLIYLIRSYSFSRNINLSL